MFGLAGLAGLGMLSSIAQPIVEAASGLSGLANFGSALGRGLSSVRGGGTPSGQSNVAMPGAAPGAQARASNPDLDFIGEMLFGSNMKKILGGVQGFQFHKDPPQYGPMSFNTSPANPYIGPGMEGLQALSLGGGYR